MQNVYIQYAIPAFLVLIFVEAMYAHLKGLRLYNLRNTLSCLGCGMFTSLLEVFIKAGLLMLYARVYENYAWTRLDNNSPVTWVTALVFFDFIWYWAHRISHEVNFLWGGHAPHHQSEEFNLSAGLRQGALQDLMYWPFYMLMAPAGYSPEMFIAHVMINKFYGFCLHTRAIGKLPLVEGILSTPSAHRVHHGMNDKYLDKNHGGIFIVFDRMFGTYQAEEEEVIYGVRSRYNSYNPVWAHFEWLASLWKDARLAGNWWDKIRIWFMPTGWRPEDVAEKFPKPGFSQSEFTKFDPWPGSSHTFRALAVFVMLAGINQVLFLNVEWMSWQMKGLLSLLTTMGLLWLGHLLNEAKRKSEADTGEIR